MFNVVTLERMFTEMDKAYVAGFTDGEGNFAVWERDYMKSDNRPGHRPGYKYHYHRIDVAIQVKQTNRLVLDQLMAEYQGSVRGPYTDKRKPNAKPFYVWSRYLGPKTLRFLDDIQPYLKLKKLHAEVVRDLIMTSSWEEKLRLKAIIKSLNHRGLGTELPLKLEGESDSSESAT